MRFLGVQRVPLYLAPYSIPARLFNDGYPSFDRGSPLPYILGPNASGLDFLVAAPLDFGTGDNPSAQSPASDYKMYWGNPQGVSWRGIGGAPNPQLFQPIYAPRYQFGGVGGAVQTNGGVSYGPQYNNGCNPESGDYERGTPVFSGIGPGGVPLICYVTLQFNCLLSCDIFGRTYIQANVATGSSNTAGNPSTSSPRGFTCTAEDGSDHYSIWRQIPLTGQALPTEGYDVYPLVDFSADGLEAFEDAFNSNNTQSGPDYIYGISSSEYFSGQTFTPVGLDPITNSYFFIQFIPMTSEAQVALAATGEAGPSIAKDNNGIYYLLQNKTSAGLQGVLFTSQVLTLPPFSFPAYSPVPIALPCYNPCGSYLLG